jgi:hypothetical protein
MQSATDALRVRVRERVQSIDDEIDRLERRDGALKLELAKVQVLEAELATTKLCLNFLTTTITEMMTIGFHVPAIASSSAPARPMALPPVPDATTGRSRAISEPGHAPSQGKEKNSHSDWTLAKVGATMKLASLRARSQETKSSLHAVVADATAMRCAGPLGLPTAQQPSAASGRAFACAS